MKKSALLAAAAVLLAGCGNTSNIDSIIDKKAVTSESVTLNSTDESVIADAEKIASDYWAQAEKITTPVPEAVDLTKLDLTEGDIDVDLTKLSGTVCYAQVSDMVNSPSKYIGKKVRAKGSFAYTTDEATGGEYFAVFIADAAACCQQGMEFTLTGEHKYPEDYPEIGKDIVVVGIFSQYVENGWTYNTIKDATMQVV